MAFHNINAEKAKILIKENKNNEDFIILDVRTSEEFDKAHIQDAILIDIYSRDFKEKINELDKEKIYFIYCRSGNRSLHAMKLMSELGFKEVYNLGDGIIEWQEAGFELVR